MFLDITAFCTFCTEKFPACKNYPNWPTWLICVAQRLPGLRSSFRTANINQDMVISLGLGVERQEADASRENVVGATVSAARQANDAEPATRPGCDEAARNRSSARRPRRGPACLAIAILEIRETTRRNRPLASPPSASAHESQTRLGSEREEFHDDARTRSIHAEQDQVTPARKYLACAVYGSRRGRSAGRGAPGIDTTGARAVHRAKRVSHRLDEAPFIGEGPVASRPCPQTRIPASRGPSARLYSRLTNEHSPGILVIDKRNYPSAALLPPRRSRMRTGAQARGVQGGGVAGWRAEEARRRRIQPARHRFTGRRGRVATGSRHNGHTHPQLANTRHTPRQMREPAVNETPLTLVEDGPEGTRRCGHIILCLSVIPASIESVAYPSACKADATPNGSIGDGEHEELALNPLADVHSPDIRLLDKCAALVLDLPIRREGHGSPAEGIAVNVPGGGVVSSLIPYRPHSQGK
ncbi:hypothetical protein DFH07DRAFT_968356 [Mycena maculata]|uniref:Uncharacterized protein n=1 Tax=Mycena maculata TaxID=230809 RepID=A0AAD7I2S4_9AGAR|nr:hypothetical protein DFH07DRAFT_968356 [Mycena maculata]